MNTNKTTTLAATNFLTEKVIATLRKKDIGAHRNASFITIHENAVRELFQTDEYLAQLAEQEQEVLEAMAETLRKEKAQAEKAAHEKAAKEKADNEKALAKVRENENKEAARKQKERDTKIAEAKAAAAKTAEAATTFEEKK